MISERVKHYSAWVQVVADGATRTRMTWIIDVLPDEIAPYVASQMVPDLVRGKLPDQVRSRI